MENLKTEITDEREEGEISLDDVSSSEEANYNNFNKNFRKSAIGKKYAKREVDIVSRDTDHGKENRRFCNELIGTGLKPITTTLQEKNDDLLPISSDEDIEFISVPGTSKQLAVHVGPKKKRKKKKKKKSGPRMLVIDDLVSIYDDEPEVLGIVSDDRRDFMVSRSYADVNKRSPSPIKRVNSPSRHTAWHIQKSPTKHYYSQLKHGRSPIRRSPSPHRKSPRKFLSPRKSPAFNSDRRELHKPSRDHSPGRYNDTYSTSLMKKVRHLETVGSVSMTNQGWSSKIDAGHNINTKADDEEDLEFLRRKALETKQPKNDVKVNENGIVKTESTVSDTGNVSDDDGEDLELRMIALRSAVMKKHYDRVQRGIRKKKSGVVVKDESPFSDSFLDSLDSYLDSDPDETNHECQRITSPTTQSSNPGNAYVEDMDLDSDVERQKECDQSYSPTDEISQRPLCETTFLNEPRSGMPIGQLPVPDININLTNNTPSQYPHNLFPYYNNQIAPNTSFTYSTLNAAYEPCIDNNPTLTSQPSALVSRDPRLRRHIDSNMEMPSFQSDRATLPVSPPEFPFATVPLNGNMNSSSTNSSNLIVVPLANNTGNSSNISPALLQQKISSSSQCLNVTNQSHEIINTKETATIIDKPQSAVTHNDIIRDLAEFSAEPFYLMGVPDITKDANKIPTLVNRTLVPVPILKINKQLQQPLPQKKSDVNNEPAFKSAEMSSVNVESHPINRPMSAFVPIKLQPVEKKSQVITTVASVFENSSSEETSAGLPNERSSKIVENTNMSNHKSTATTVNSQSTDLSQSTMMSANTSKTKPGRSNTSGSKIDTIKETQEKVDNRGSSKIVSNEIMAKKITIKRNSKTIENEIDGHKDKTLSGETKKSHISSTKIKDAVKKSDVKKAKRSKSVNKSEVKSTEKLKGHLDSSRSSGDISKQKKNITRKVLKTKTIKQSESNIEKANVNKPTITKSNDKKRRSSVDEDEESLRAALLASLPKRTKTSDSKSTTTISKSIEENADSVKKKVNIAKSLSKENQKSDTVSTLSLATVSPKSINREKIADQSKATVNIENDKIVTKKRPNNTSDEGPLTKLIKNSTKPSTDVAKILNVAEKLVDAEIQRKLAQQQAAIGLLANKTQQSTKTNLPRHTKDSSAPINPKITASKNLERMIIRLSEDSDSDSDIDNEITKANTKKLKLPSKDVNKAPTIPITDFEKSVEEFLRSQREKQESSTTSSITATTIKSSASSSAKQTTPITNTPLAVRHLPASKQEEYRRLKQCIAEREQQKINRTTQTITKNHNQTILSKEEQSATSSSVSNMITIDTTSTATAKLQPKMAMLKTDDMHQTPSDIPCKGSSVQSQISRSTLELLEQKVDNDITEKNDNMSVPPLLTDIPITSDPSLLGMASDNIRNYQNIQATMVNNLDSETSELNLNTPIEHMDNLTIQFPNIRDDSVPFSRHVSVRNDTTSNELLSTPEISTLGLRVLTTDQLNLKFENTDADIDNDETQIETKNIVLNESRELLDNDESRKMMENIDKTSIEKPSIVETCKIEANYDIISPTTSNLETIDLKPSISDVSEHNNLVNEQLNNDELTATAKSEFVSALNATIARHNMEATNDPVINTTIDAPTTSMYGMGESTESKELVHKKIQKLSENESNVQIQLETLNNLTEGQQRVQLTTTEKDLVTKRYVLLHNLNQFADDLREWEIQEDLTAEVYRLRIQLQLAEERLAAQRAKTTEMSPQTAQKHKIIHEERNQCSHLAKLCQEMGLKLVGPAYKVPNTGAQLLKERWRKVANMTTQLAQKKVSSTDLNNHNNDVLLMQLISNNSSNENIELRSKLTDKNLMPVQNSTSVKIENFNDRDITTVNIPSYSNDDKVMSISTSDDANTSIQPADSINNITLSESNDNVSFPRHLTKNTDYTDISASNGDWLKIEDEKPPMQSSTLYESVLTTLNTPRHIDPNGVLCPYELMGICNDETCRYNHLDANRS